VCGVYLDIVITGTKPDWEQAVRTVQSKAGTTGLDWAATIQPIVLFPCTLSLYKGQYNLMNSNSHVWPPAAFMNTKMTEVTRSLWSWDFSYIPWINKWLSVHLINFCLLKVCTLTSICSLKYKFIYTLEHVPSTLKHYFILNVTQKRLFMKSGHGKSVLENHCTRQQEMTCMWMMEIFLTYFNWRL